MNWRPFADEKQLGTEKRMETFVLNQRYQFRAADLVGMGGMATVYRARDLYLDRLVAVKILREPYASDGAFRQRFLDEARAAARLDHPNVVRIYDVGIDGRRPYIVLELVEGEDLRALIDRMRPVPIPLALNLTQQICAGVGQAHRLGLVHCDLKPQNILITRAGQVKVADFGIARAIQNGTAASATPENVVWGSPHYIAPERVAGQALADTRSTMTFDEPPGCMLTPSRLSPASMVRFWWLTMSSWASCRNSAMRPRNRWRFTSSSAASTSSIT